MDSSHYAKVVLLALLSGAGNLLAQTNQVTASPSSLSFGNQTIGTTSASQTVTFSNSYSVTVPITGISVVEGSIVVAIAHTSSPPPDFTISNNTCGTSLDSGQNCTVSVTFNPHNAGTRSANLQMAFTANGQPNTVDVGMLGTGLTSGLTFVAVTPCRIADTRGGIGPFGGPIVAGGTSRDFTIPSSTCNIPNTASAYSLNVTVVPPGIIGFLAIYPSGGSQPLVSTLNSDGRVKANAAIVPAGTNGAVTVYTSHDTHVILDINGYFVSSGGVTGLEFYSMTPCRILDTRNTDGPFGGPYLSAGVVRTVSILTSTCGVPTAAQAYSLNFTAIPHQPIGFMATWPTGQSQPLVSTLNASVPTVTANAALVPAGSSGAIQVYSSNDTDLVVDINGYFAPAGTNGLALYTMTPCRVVDTRGLTGAITGTFVEGVTNSTCGAPAASGQAFVLNATVVPQSSLGYLALWPDQSVQPLVSTLNASDGVVTSNLAIVPTTNGSVDAFASSSTQLILDISSYFAP